jgi:hypothetical protein
MPQAVDAQQLSQKVGPSASLITHELPAWNAMELVPPGLFWQPEVAFLLLLDSAPNPGVEKVREGCAVIQEQFGHGNFCGTATFRPVIASARSHSETLPKMSGVA